MDLKKLTIPATAGMHYVTHPELAGANVISVKRTGSRVYLTETMPSGSSMDVLHNGGEGRLYFSPDNVFNDDEDIFFIYTNGGGIIVPEPPIEPPLIINGDISNNTYPLAGNEINAVSFDGQPINIWSYPSFGSFSFPVDESPNNYCLFNVDNPGLNKQLSVTVTTTSTRQIVVIDSIGNSQTVSVSTGTYIFNNVTIIGTAGCRIIMN